VLYCILYCIISVGCGHDLDNRRDQNESGCGSVPESWCGDNTQHNAGRMLSKRRIRVGLCKWQPRLYSPSVRSCIHPRWCCRPDRWGAHGQGERFGRGTKPGTEDPAGIGSGHLEHQERPHGSRCRCASFFCGACMDRNAPRSRFWTQNTFCVLCGESAQRGYLRQWSRWALHAWSCAAVRPVNIFTPNLIEYRPI